MECQTKGELFGHWMNKLFLPSIPPSRPVLLLLDGHSSHFEPDTIRMASKEGVVIICLPPHTTHVSQPLDVSFFRPLKVYWSNACHKYVQENPGRIVTKFQFSSLFSTAWYKAIKPENLISGFRKCGICPFNSKAIVVSEIPQREDLPTTESEANPPSLENDDAESSNESKLSLISSPCQSLKKSLHLETYSHQNS